MASSVSVGDVKAALAARTFPSVTTYNRLEGRPRTVSFDRALRAEVRDALWMLTRQWQLGEFRGDDAGSPVATKLLLQTTRLTKYQPDAAPTEDFPYDLCLEAKVERRNIPLTRAGQPASLDLRLAMGRYWLKLIKPLPNDYSSNYIKAYAIPMPDPTDPTQANLCAHPEAWQTVEAVAGRAMDGGGLYTYLTADAAHHAYDNVTGIVGTDHHALDDCATRFLAWFQRTLTAPSAGEDAWAPSHLEYQFAASAPLPAGEKVYTADEYYQGRLDWYSLDVDPTAKPLGNVAGAGNTGLPADAPRTMIPSPVSFAGMPNTRWWAFEDRATNFGDIDAATTDLAKLLFIEFALVYSNDWFIIPYSLPLGSLATIRGMAVTNVFGEREWITAAGSATDANWQQWGLFSINMAGDPAAAPDRSLLVLPTAAMIQRGEPIEDVSVIRDESANMVWGIEKTVQLVTGDPKRGIEAARELTAFYTGIVGASGGSAVTPAAPIQYQLMSSVPENWIPFVPVHVENNNREIQLQRASMPRNIGENPAALPAALRKVKPQTTLLRQGLDQLNPAAYFIYEEEVPRAGARVFQHYQRTRGCDDGTVCGRVLTWLRAEKQTGRGEGSSGLAFDQLVNSPPIQSK
ncbi:MAG: hypothetical protein WCB10_19505 [Steroidobacteraceae bacterium]